MNELEAAKIMIGGLLLSGKINDPAELRFLKERLDELERRIARAKVK
jgi:tetrahydromethanopterin S-methyltransferase subunit G